MLILEVVGSFKAIGTLKNTDGTSMQLRMKSGILGTKIKDATGKAVASIHREFLNAREIVFEKQTYMVEIQPGFNIAIIAAMCICLDEMRNEKKHVRNCCL